MVLNWFPQTQLPRTQNQHQETLQTVASSQTIASSQRDVDYDLVIVGGGIVGLSLACALKDAGIKVAIAEAQLPEIGAARRRAYHVSLLSGRIFADMGVWEEILSKSTTFHQIQLSDADHPGIVKFCSEDLGTNALGYVSEHGAIVTALRNCLEGCSNVTYLCPAELQDVQYRTEDVELQLTIAGKQQQIRTRLLVAADGARSPVRQKAGIRTHGWQYWQSCITAVIQPEKTHGNIAYERFWTSGPFAILPLRDNRCQIVWTAPHAEAKALAALDSKQFMIELRHRYGDQMGQLTLASEPQVFPVQLMQSDRYVLPRLALVGDAAHCCHPVGGQGLNMGIRDAAALAQVLRLACQQGEDVGDVTVLKRYDTWRRRENLTILGFTDLLDRCFSNNWLPLVIARRLGLWMLQKIHPLKVFALQLMTGMRGRAPKLAQR